MSDAPQGDVLGNRLTFSSFVNVPDKRLGKCLLATYQNAYSFHNLPILSLRLWSPTNFSLSKPAPLPPGFHRPENRQTEVCRTGAPRQSRSMPPSETRQSTLLCKVMSNIER